MSEDAVNVLILLATIAGIAGGLIGLVWMAMHLSEHGFRRNR